MLGLDGWLRTCQDTAPSALRPLIVGVVEAVCWVVGFGHELGHCRLSFC